MHSRWPTLASVGVYLWLPNPKKNNKNKKNPSPRVRISSCYHRLLSLIHLLLCILR